MFSDVYFRLEAFGRLPASVLEVFDHSFFSFNHSGNYVHQDRNQGKLFQHMEAPAMK